MFFHQLVFAHHTGAVNFLAGCNFVFDQLEHIGVRRQRKHRHHQALDTGRHNKLIVRMLQVVQKVPVKQGFALLVQAQHGVHLGLGLVRQQRAQKLDVGAGRFHVHQEIGARKTEQRGNLLHIEQHGVDVQLAR